RRGSGGLLRHPCRAGGARPRLRRGFRCRRRRQFRADGVGRHRRDSGHGRGRALRRGALQPHAGAGAGRHLAPHPHAARCAGAALAVAARRFAGDRLVVATHNKGKLVEIAELLSRFGVTALGAAALGLPEPKETGTTFEANAELKARAAAGPSGIPALADDSGLVVPALGGAPGIYSARWAGPSKDFRVAMERVQRELADRDRAAHFVAAKSTAASPGRRAAGAASATIRSSSRRGTRRPSARWRPRRSTGSAIAPAPLRSLRRQFSLSAHRGERKET